MAMKSKKRMRRRALARYKTLALNASRRIQNYAAKGKERFCQTCAASLICNADRPPESVWRCEHCNKCVAVWGGSLWDFPRDCERGVVGVNRCPHTRVVVYVCVVCENKVHKKERKRRGVTDRYLCLN